MRNGWIIKRCYFDALGEISSMDYIVMVEEKNWLGFMRKKTLKQWYSYSMDGGFEPKAFASEGEAEEYLKKYMSNKNPREQWIEEVVKTIAV